MSGGTRASSAGVMLAPGFAWHGGRLVGERTARHGRAFEIFPGKRARGDQRRLVASTSRCRACTPACATSTSSWAGSAPPREPMRVRLGRDVASVLKLPGARDALDAVFGRLVKGSTGGPDAAARATSTLGRRSPRRCDAAGTVLADVRLEGVNGYDFTARHPRLGRRRPPPRGGLQGTGALGPVDGFGLDALEAGCAEAGIARVA